MHMASAACSGYVVVVTMHTCLPLGASYLVYICHYIYKHRYLYQVGREDGRQKG
jgi:hypothetical protein